VKLMCRVLDVPRSSYYAHRKRPPSARAAADKQLLAEIRSVHTMSKATYGSPRVHAELQGNGIRAGRNRVARLMAEDGLAVKRPRRFCTTTDSRHEHPIAPNVLARAFSVDSVGGLDRVWVADITYVPTQAGWLYLAVVLDLASRRVVGWAMKDTMQTALVTDALEMAILQRNPGRGLVHHSDRGVQYASGDYRDQLARQGTVVSMSRKGNCWDNAVAESFFATLEWELIERSDWRTRDEARSAIFQYLEGWYNTRRRHSSLGFLSPAQYEQQLVCRAEAA
jgi:transposase InsO family protein